MPFVVVYVNQKSRRYLSPFLTPNRKDKLDLLENLAAQHIHPTPTKNHRDIHGLPNAQQIPPQLLKIKNILNPRFHLLSIRQKRSF